MNTKSQSALSQLVLLTGAKKTKTVDKASGNAAPLKKGIRLPCFDVHRSDKDAIQGSVTASKILPTAVIAPMMVIIPRMASPCGINNVLIEASDVTSG